jgi:hypothetical protein
MALLTFPSVAAAAERARLDGWGPFKFSMSFAEAKIAAGTKATLGDNNTLIYAATIEGAPYQAAVWFTGVGGKVRDIALTPAREIPRGASEESCFALHPALVQQLSRRYGPPDSEKDGPIPINSIQRRSTFNFANGATIDVATSYEPVLTKCSQLIDYRSPAGVPAEKF